MTTITSKLKKTVAHEAPKWHSFDDVFKSSQKSHAFKQSYNEEVSRLQIAKQVRALRSAKRLTQKVVAERAGMPQSVVARVESGERGITLDTLGRIASALGKEVQLA